jgi:hypothetical protein
MNKENGHSELSEKTLEHLQEVAQEYARQAHEGVYASLNTAEKAVEVRHAKENQTPKP